jgi:hypothetical protein
LFKTTNVSVETSNSSKNHKIFQTLIEPVKEYLNIFLADEEYRKEKMKNKEKVTSKDLLIYIGDDLPKNTNSSKENENFITILFHESGEIRDNKNVVNIYYFSSELYGLGETPDDYKSIDEINNYKNHAPKDFIILDYFNDNKKQINQQILFSGFLNKDILTLGSRKTQKLFPEPSEPKDNDSYIYKLLLWLQNYESKKVIDFAFDQLPIQCIESNQSFFTQEKKMFNQEGEYCALLLNILFKLYLDKSVKFFISDTKYNNMIGIFSRNKDMEHFFLLFDQKPDEFYNNLIQIQQYSSFNLFINNLSPFKTFAFMFWAKVEQFLTLKTKENLPGSTEPDNSKTLFYEIMTTIKKQRQELRDKNNNNNNNNNNSRPVPISLRRKNKLQQSNGNGNS